MNCSNYTRNTNIMQNPCLISGASMWGAPQFYQYRFLVSLKFNEKHVGGD